VYQKRENKREREVRKREVNKRQVRKRERARMHDKRRRRGHDDDVAVDIPSVEAEKHNTGSLRERKREWKIFEANCLSLSLSFSFVHLDSHFTL
jgi:hypothetical protein